MGNAWLPLRTLSLLCLACPFFAAEPSFLLMHWCWLLFSSLFFLIVRSPSPRWQPISSQSPVVRRYLSSPWRGLVCLGPHFSITLAATTYSCAGRREVNNHPPVPKHLPPRSWRLQLTASLRQRWMQRYVPIIARSSCLSPAQSAYKHGLHIYETRRATRG